MLSSEQITQYEKDGFLVVPNFATTQDITQLKSQIQEIIKEIEAPQLTIFTTDDQARVSDDYFLTSGDKIRCFFEEQAVEEGGLATEKSLAINKIGHALHDLDPVFQKFSYQDKVREIGQELGLNKPAIVQSQYIFKPPRIGGKVTAHIDSTFLYTEPMSCTGLWIALEDATIENGCLWAIPHSHKDYQLQERFVRNASNDGTIFIKTDVPRQTWDISKMEALEVKAGDMIILHGLCVHQSAANTSKFSRHAYVLHLIDLECDWVNDNWLQKDKFYAL